VYVIYKRINHVLIFHKTVYIITVVSESALFVIFAFAALRDFIPIDRNYILHILLACSSAFASYIVLLLREKVRNKSLSRIDFALYEKDFEALIMMFTMHELIERSSFDDA
jgi:ABC-type Fe3+-siderophore transport system permease subunit